MKSSRLIALAGAGLVVIVVLSVAGMYFQMPGYRASEKDSSGAQGYRGGTDFGLSQTEGMAAPASPPAPTLMRQEASKNALALEDTAADTTVNSSQRLIIKTGTLSMVVKDVPEAVKRVQDFAKTKGGFVVSSNISKDGLSPFAEVTIRIPSDVFDGGVQEVKAMGEVKSEIVNGQDVTEEYVDLTSQLRNLQATQTQFLKIMEKAVKIEDVLAVQRELSRIQGEIEVLQGRMKYLEQSAKLSTLTVYLSTNPENLPVVDDQEKWKPVAVVKDAVRSLLDMGKGLINAIIWVVVYLPVWIVLGGLVWIIRRQWRKMQMKK